MGVPRTHFYSYDSKKPKLKKSLRINLIFGLYELLNIYIYETYDGETINMALITASFTSSYGYRDSITY